MGLDIHIHAANIDELHDLCNAENFDLYSLSRNFCNLMCRQHVVDHLPELNQIGELTGVDISPLYEMERYPDQDELDFHLKNADTVQQRQEILARSITDKENLNDNIDKILILINILIEKLTPIADLKDRLLPTSDVTLVEDYFDDFPIDKGDGYIGNNFGQDLRNFKRFLEFARAKGSRSVWFKYG